MEKKLLHNEQYHVKPRSLEEIDTLIKALKKKGYRILHDLDNVLNFEYKPAGICVDNGIGSRNGGKCVACSNVTCMGCYYTWSHKSPLRVEDILDNIEKLIDEPDIEFYNDLLDKRTDIEKQNGWQGYVCLSIDVKK